MGHALRDALIAAGHVTRQRVREVTKPYVAMRAYKASVDTYVGQIGSLFPYYISVFQKDGLPRAFQCMVCGKKMFSTEGTRLDAQSRCVRDGLIGDCSAQEGFPEWFDRRLCLQHGVGMHKKGLLTKRIKRAIFALHDAYENYSRMRAKIEEDEK